ncbi:hypothetical protein [Campylobacter hyointestinalis]|uniref:hypothetical protein n=1 Tax=Campylobacter hyointestinalis TaxID=198 RepID=UPI000A7A3DA3|nr:hypothetical protein [Campylobacter hyointestinalis]
MKNLIFSLIFAFILIGCGNGSRHHMTLNDKNGFDTTYDTAKKELKIVAGISHICYFSFLLCAGLARAKYLS